MMTPTSWIADIADETAARWSGGANVLALLFAQPDSVAIRTLDSRREYFDYRTGDSWDLFFPGYYRSSKGAEFERRAGARPAGTSDLEEWFFSPRDFNAFRRDVSDRTNGLWHYSGGTDLVLVPGWLPADGEPLLYWDETLSGSVTDDVTGVTTKSLPEVIESISHDLEEAWNSPDYGVSDVTNPRPPDTGGSVGRDILVNTLSGILAALGMKAIAG